MCGLNQSEPFVMDVPSKVILCLLEVDGKPIRGKQFLVHQVFLVSQEVCADAAKHFEWYPYQYGPYSTIMANRLNRMQDLGYVGTEKVKGVWAFSITPEGRTFLDEHELDEDAVYNMWEVQNLFDDEELGEMKDFAISMGAPRFKDWLLEKYPGYFSRARF